MKTGKITAKLRDAVPVCFMVNGEEVKRYANIEIPDSLKELEMLDFHFNTQSDGKITFEISFEEGVLPEVFPEPRTRQTRAAKAAAKAQRIEEPVVVTEVTAESEEPTDMEVAYNVTGIQRKNLVVAVSAFLGVDPEYKAAPSFAYTVGEYTIDKAGTLTGKTNKALIDALAAQGFTAA